MTSIPEGLTETTARLAGRSRVQSSTMVNMRITCPVLTASLKKSIRKISGIEGTICGYFLVGTLLSWAGRSRRAGITKAVVRNNVFEGIE
jgi:hypothetical protein